MNDVITVTALNADHTTTTHVADFAEAVTPWYPDATDGIVDAIGQLAGLVDSGEWTGEEAGTLADYLGLVIDDAPSIGEAVDAAIADASAHLGGVIKADVVGDMVEVRIERSWRCGCGQTVQLVGPVDWIEDGAIIGAYDRQHGCGQSNYPSADTRWIDPLHVTAQVTQLVEDVIAKDIEMVADEADSRRTALLEDLRAARDALACGDDWSLVEDGMSAGIYRAEDGSLAGWDEPVVEGDDGIIVDESDLA